MSGSYLVVWRAIPLAIVMAVLLTGGCPEDFTSNFGNLVAGGVTATPDTETTTGGEIEGAETSGEAESGGGGAGKTYPMLLTTMTHMESSFNDDKDQSVFTVHVTQLRFGMDLATEYGAKLTIESEKPFARACTFWGHNMLAEVLERGHGVGTHMDFGMNDPLMPVENYAAKMAENKALVDGLVGAENNRGYSGGGGENDWALAGALAGFEAVDGVVALSYLSMPIENRPDESWTDEYIRDEVFHDHAPVDLYQRIYPFMVADAKDFVADEPGVILVSAGDLGRVDGFVEDTAGKSCIGGECPMTTEDVDLIVATVREIAATRDPARLAKLTVYFAVSDFIPQNEEVLRYFFASMQTLQNEGLITWATQSAVLDAYNEVGQN